jgi:hypothetical protein
MDKGYFRWLTRMDEQVRTLLDNYDAHSGSAQGPLIPRSQDRSLHGPSRITCKWQFRGGEIREKHRRVNCRLLTTPVHPRRLEAVRANPSGDSTSSIPRSQVRTGQADEKELEKGFVSSGVVNA